MDEKPVVIVEIQADGNVTVGTNIGDKVLLRNAIRLAEELIIADALKKASVQQQVIPVKTIPTLLRKSN